MNDQKTLRELLDGLRKTSGNRVPGKEALKKEGTLVASYEGESISISIFDCGYALAETERRWTVFRVAEECGEYRYNFDEFFLGEEMDSTLHAMEAEFFLDLPWPIRLEMAAEDRLESNNDDRFDCLICEHPWVLDERPTWLMSRGRSAEDEAFRKINHEEMMACLTDKQRETLALHLDGYTQCEIGERLGISQVAVGKRIQGAIAKLQETFEKTKFE